MSLDSIHETINKSSLSFFSLIQYSFCFSYNLVPGLRNKELI